MPLGFHKQSNRSRQALNDPSAGPSTGLGLGTGNGTPSTGSISGDDNSTTRSDAAAREARNNSSQPQHFSPLSGTDNPASQAYTTQPIAPDHDPRYPQNKGVEAPSRSQSTRYSTGNYQQPPLQSQGGGSVDDLIVDSRRYQQPPVAQGPPIPTPEHKKRYLFGRLRAAAAGASRNSAESKQSPHSNPSDQSNQNLGRRLSKKEQVPAVRTSQQNISLEQQELDWQAAQDLRKRLPSPLETNEDDAELDPYLVRETDPDAPQANYPPTIRTVQGDSGEYRASDGRQQFESQQQFEQHQFEAQRQFEAQQAFEAQQQQQHLRVQSDQQNTDTGNQAYYQSHLQPQVNISPASALLINDPYRQANPETISQISYDSPIEQREPTRPVSVQSNNGQSPTATQPGYGVENPPRAASNPQVPRPPSLYGMAPPPNGAQTRRPADPKQTMQAAQGQGQPPVEAPPNYSRGQFTNAQQTVPGQGQVAVPPPGPPPGPNYRGGPPQREQSSVGEQGRSGTPPAVPGPGGQDIHELYKEISTKYKKVKGLYFEKTAQVEQLQNTLANQRLSQSRTSLDDSEYMTRFNRLEGAITNLAFNIRKDWRTVPTWISHSVNQEAMKIGKQEMTAVGRACITKFLVEELFNHTFHPGLDPQLSSQLKLIEQNIRHFSPALNNLEESDALTAKIVQWRLATLEGLKGVLSSQECEVHKATFSRAATISLAEFLTSFLTDPPPPGIEDSAHMIIELAVGIASNIPLESRDIAISYPMPGDMLQPLVMKIENPIASLEHPGAETNEGDSGSVDSGDKEEGIGNASEIAKEEGKVDSKGRKEKTRSGMLSGLMGNAGKKGVVPEPVEKKVLVAPVVGQPEDGSQKVRFAGFVGVEVRGRQVLLKAPVWTVS